MKYEEKASADTTLTCRGALLCRRAGHLQQNRHKSCFSRCFLGRFAQVCFQNAVKYAILKTEKHTPPP